MDEREAPRTWSVGELAAACGVTVRTLHHYERLGLLVASARTAAGHRRYSDDDVRRLYRICALRQLGLRLDQVALWLESEVDLATLLRRQLEAVEREVDRYDQLRSRLERMVELCERAGLPTIDDLLEVMEVMRWRADAEEAMSALRAAHDAGADPTDVHVQDVVRRILQLKSQFTDGDPERERAVRGRHEDPAWDAARAVIPRDPDLRAFWRRARDAGR